MEDKKNIKGVRTTKIIYPVLALIIFFQIIIITLSMIINVKSDILADKTKKQTDVTSDITTILSTASKLSDTATSFSHSPRRPAGPTVFVINGGPIDVYFDTISDENVLPELLLEKISDYKLSTNVMTYVNYAIEQYSNLIDYHAHALTLVDYALKLDNSVDTTALDNVLSILPTYELTEEEKAYTYEEAVTAANEILFTQEYSTNKGNISSNVNVALDKYKDISKDEIDEYSNELDWFRRTLWFFAFFTMIVTTMFFISLLVSIVIPIVKFSKKIDAGEKLDTDNRVYETNVLANAYNELIDRHNEFEKQLRFVAEKDSLTGMLNRYSYNEFLSREIEQSEKVCVFMLDINDLKEVNDTLGHAKGDELIKNASSCIKECFLVDDNCYRIGGDEFVAILKDINEEDIKNYILKFKEFQQKYNVSIALGYAYSDDVLRDGYEYLMKKADELMYINKKAIKEQL